MSISWNRLAVVFILSLAFSWPIFATPTLTLESRLEVGLDLKVSLHGAKKEKKYFLHLLDDFGVEIAAVVISTDLQGKAENELLWQRAGVSLCGCPADIEHHRYTDHDEAAAFLEGRFFSVELRNDTGGFEASALVEIVSGTQPVYFWSHSAGNCQEFETLDASQVIFLSGRNVTPGEKKIVLAEGSAESVAELEEPEEARSAYASNPQVLVVPESGRFTVQISVGDELPPGAYTAVLVPLSEETVSIETFVGPERHLSSDDCDKGPEI